MGKGKKVVKEKKGKILSIRMIINMITCSKKAKAKEEAAIKMGIHNSNLWEAQLNIMDLSRKHYRLEE